MLTATKVASSATTKMRWAGVERRINSVMACIRARETIVSGERIPYHFSRYADNPDCNAAKTSGYGGTLLAHQSGGVYRIVVITFSRPSLARAVPLWFHNEKQP